MQPQGLEGAKKPMSDGSRRSRGSRRGKKNDKKIKNQIKPISKFSFGGYSKGDAFRDEVLRAVIELTKRDLTKAEQCLAEAMLDPGHSYENMKAACAFPDGASLGNEICHNPMQLDFDITVGAGSTHLVYAINHPIIAAIGINAGNWYAIPWPNTMAIKNPGRWFLDKGILSYRKLASSITADNITPMNDRGGMCYSDIIRSKWSLQQASAAMNPAVNTDCNNPCVYGLSSTASDFTSSESYRTGSEKGAYVIGRPYNLEWVEVPSGQNSLSGQYPSDTLIGIADKDHQLKYTQLNGVQTTVGTSMTYLASWPIVGGKPVIVPFCFDNFEVQGICYQAPAKDQLIHIKIHALWEYQLESGKEANFPKKEAVPNEQFVKAIKDAALLFPQQLPPEYNSWGAVGRWFQNLYKGLKPALDPLISTSLGPIAGTAINSSLDALSRYTIK